MANRNAFIKVVKEQFAMLPNSIDNVKLAAEWLKGLSDKEFEDLVVKMEAGETYLSYIVDNFDTVFTIGQIKLAAEEIGAPIYSPVLEEDPNTGIIAESNETHWIAFQPTRRQIQDVDDKRAAATDSNSRDLLTGQVTGDSKGSAIAPGQLSAIISRNCPATSLEFARFRGGDMVAGPVFTNELIQTGQVSAEALSKIKSTPTVNESMASYLFTAHIANNIVG